MEAYRRLKPLQELVIPVCYGEANYDGARALVFQDVGGASLAEPAGATLELGELSRLLQECYRALHALGVHHEDPQLGNFRLVGERLIAVDLERVAFDMSADDNAFFMAPSIYHLASRYQDIRAFLRSEGLLEAG